MLLPVEFEGDGVFGGFCGAAFACYDNVNLSAAGATNISLSQSEIAGTQTNFTPILIITLLLGGITLFILQRGHIFTSKNRLNGKW